jgi:diacylglycerol kinase (ATP)
MKVRKIIQSFRFAVDGLVYGLKTQRNMRVHFAAALLVLMLSLFFKLGGIETLLLFIAIFLVIITELINTAVEKTVDMFTKDYHPLAKIAKNTAAAAVLVAALNSVVVGIIIFAGKLGIVKSEILNLIMVLVAVLFATMLTVSMRFK